MVTNMACCNGIHKGKFGIKAKSVKIGIFGLDNAGKTTTTKAIIGESLETVAPTIGYSSYRKKIGQYDITFYDLGGGKRVRDIWKHYLAEVYGIIFVVDSSEIDRLNECKDELEKLLSNRKVQGKPILLLANKQDKETALDDKDIVSKINLEDLVTDNKCHCRLELCAATIGIGNKLDPPIRSGLKWLLRIIDVLRESSGLDQRVVRETEEAQRLEREQANEKRLQVLKAREERAKAESPDDDVVIEDEDPFKPISKAVAEATNTVNTDRGYDDKSSTLANPQDLFQHNDLVGVNNSAINTETKDLVVYSDDVAAKDAMEILDDQATDSSRRRRRRARPKANMETNGNENLTVPYSSNQSPTNNRIRSPSPATGESTNRDSGPIAASLRLSGNQGTVEQNETVEMTSYTKQVPNVQSSDAFI